MTGPVGAAPPTARLTDCSKNSLVAGSNLPAASLNARGESVAKDNSCAILCELSTDVDGECCSSRVIVGSRTHNTAVPKRQFRTPASQRSDLDLRWLSTTDVKNAANAFQISPIANTCVSETVPSAISGAIFAMNSIRPGISIFVHCRSMTFPDVDVTIKVLAQ